MTEKIYCSQCGSENVQIKTWVNPNSNQIHFDFRDSVHGWCEDCAKSRDIVSLKCLWENLEDVLINKEEEIEERFLFFEPGTDRQEIWRWFDERLPDGLGKFLDSIEENENVKDTEIVVAYLADKTNADIKTIEQFVYGNWEPDTSPLPAFNEYIKKQK